MFSRDTVVDRISAMSWSGVEQQGFGDWQGSSNLLLSLSLMPAGRREPDQRLTSYAGSLHAEIKRTPTE